MTTKTFTKDELDKGLKGLIDSYNIFVPIKEGDFHNFKPLQEGTIPNFNMENTRLSPKSIVYPQSERMFEYSVDQSDEGANIIQETAKDYPPQVVVGIKPCDRHACEIVKRNFDLRKPTGKLRPALTVNGVPTRIVIKSTVTHSHFTLNLRQMIWMLVTGRLTTVGYDRLKISSRNGLITLYWLLRMILCVMNYCVWVNSVLLKLLRSKRPDVKDYQISYTNILIRYSSLHVENQKLIDSGVVRLKYEKLTATWP